MVAIAGRYGHQPASEVMRMTADQLGRFNQGLSRLIKAESQSGQGMRERFASGG